MIIIIIRILNYTLLRAFQNTSAKLFQVVIFNQIFYYLEKKWFNPLQFGFRKPRSTFQSIDRLVEEVSQAFEEKSFAQATLLILSKAFDCIGFNNLVTKLKFLALMKNLFCSLWQIFIHCIHLNRWQKVYIDEHWLQESVLANRVCQGSVFGPWLFPIWINDLPISVSVPIKQKLSHNFWNFLYS